MRVPLLMLLAVPIAGWAAESPDPFGYFVGDWHCSGHFISNGEAISSTLAIIRDERTDAVIVRHDDQAPHSYHALELWTATRTPGRFRASIADKFGGQRWYESEGWSNDSLVWARESERFSYTRKGEGRMTVDWLVAKPGGEFKLGDTLDCAKG